MLCIIASPTASCEPGVESNIGVTTQAARWPKHQKEVSLHFIKRQPHRPTCAYSYYCKHTTEFSSMLPHLKVISILLFIPLHRELVGLPIPPHTVIRRICSTSYAEKLLVEICWWLYRNMVSRACLVEYESSNDRLCNYGLCWQSAFHRRLTESNLTRRHRNSTLCRHDGLIGLARGTWKRRGLIHA